MSSKSVATEVERRMKALRMTAKGLSRAAGLNETAVRDLLKGRVRNPRHDTLTKLARALGCAVSDLIGERVEPRTSQTGDVGLNATATFEPSTYRVLELDVRAQGGAGALLDNDNGHPVVDEWRIPRDLIRGQTTAPEERLVIGRIYGDSMEPTYRAGDRVLIDTSDRIPSPAGVFFVWDGLGLVCKHVEVVPNSKPLTVVLKPENRIYETYTFKLDEITIQGRVIGRWEWT